MSVFRGFLPAPLYSAVLLLSWLALARSASLGNVLLGLAFALAIPHITNRLRLVDVRVRRPLVIMRYLLLIARDVIVANVEVAIDVVTWRRPQSKFVIIPLDLREPLGLAVLSMVTAIVPGTVWSELAFDQSALLLHVWNVEDEGAFIARFKARYERPLCEVFE